MVIGVRLNFNFFSHLLCDQPLVAVKQQWFTFDKIGIRPNAGSTLKVVKVILGWAAFERNWKMVTRMMCCPSLEIGPDPEPQPQQMLQKLMQ